jgi:hypothetical protein
MGSGMEVALRVECGAGPIGGPGFCALWIPLQPTSAIGAVE